MPGLASVAILGGPSKQGMRTALLLVLLAAPGCLAAQLGVHGGAAIDSDGRVNPDLGLRAGLGFSGDGSGGLILVGVDSILAPGARPLYGAGPSAAFFWERPAVFGLAGSLSYTHLFMSDGGELSIGPMLTLTLMRPFVHSVRATGKPIRDKGLSFEATRTHTYVNVGGEVGLGAAGVERSLNDVDWIFLARPGALLLVTWSQQ